MTLAFSHLLVFVVAYLIGSIPFGVLVARAKGIDLRKEGSGNVGATNVGRVLGLRWFFVVFSFDFLKGFGPVLLASLLMMQDQRLDLAAGDLALVAGLAACLGHVFSIFLGFRGGKAVATGVGMLTALAPFTGVGALLIFALVFAAKRYVSLASILAAGSAPLLYLAAHWLGVYDLSFEVRDGLAPLHWLRFSVIAVLSTLILVKHRSNIVRLLRGEELRAGKR